MKGVTNDPFKVIASMEAEACEISWNEKRQDKIDEMMRYTKVILGQKEGKSAHPNHIGRCDYNRRGELIGFYLEPIAKEFIKQL